MYKNMEGVHAGLLRQVMGKTYKRQRDGTWRNKAATRVFKEARTQTLGTYIDNRQVTVVEWVELRPILEVCDREIGYKGGARRLETWWRQTAARKQLGEKLEEISSA